MKWEAVVCGMRLVVDPLQMMWGVDHTARWGSGHRKMWEVDLLLTTLVADHRMTWGATHMATWVVDRQLMRWGVDHMEKWAVDQWRKWEADYNQKWVGVVV